MYLKSVKLAGFKSFVDPTTIPIRGYMNAIVGPNGCGKSNVVDGIRWVIGEMSAKQLRGQSMSDVIFNGTHARKPVGKAAIELLFENNKGKITGEYANYAEIAIRREVGREGQSSYFINGIQVRRRDVIDIFLGTGLGPRSYAIIEQGMISNFIEAKPEDLRIYIEEAAGTSKYKERRRETENRMRHTRENLDRINDICEELEKQLRHLKRQANAAERYKIYKQEERLLEAQMKALEWQQLELKLQAQDRLINDQDLLREEQMAKQRHIETEIEKVRVLQETAVETHHAVQKKYYGFGAEIARLEQHIKSTQEQATQWAKELEENQSLWEELNDNTFECQNQIKELEAELIRLNPKTTDIRLVADEARRALTVAEADMHQWQAKWDAFQTEVLQTSSRVEVGRTNIEHHRRQLNDFKQQQQRLQDQLNSLKITELREEIAPLLTHAESVHQQLAEANVKLQQYSQHITQQRETNHTLNAHLQIARQKLQTSESRYASLEAVQKSALGKDREQTHAWLMDRHLSDHPRFGQNLQVQEGWEVAVETVLRGYFDAVCVEAIDPYIESLAALSEGQLMLLESHPCPPTTQVVRPTLANKVESDWPFHAWLTGIYVADNVAEAKQMRATLAEHESVITRDGIWMGARWVRVSKDHDPQRGILIREQQLKQLKQEIATLQAQCHVAEAQWEAGQTQLNHLEIERDACHHTYQSFSTTATEVQTTLSTKQARLEEAERRHHQLQQAVTECAQRQVSTHNELETIQQQLQRWVDTQQQDDQRRTQFMTQRDQLRDILEKQRTDTQRKEQAANELEIRLSANESQLTLLRQTVQRDERQLEQLSDRQHILTAQLTESDTPLKTMQEELQTQLERQLEIATALRSAEEQLEQYNQELKEWNAQRNQLQHELSHFQEKIQELRVERQSIVVRQTTIRERLNESDYVLETVLSDLPEEATLQIWAERLSEVEQRIQRLGSINLAAIEEYDSTNERKEYLDKQKADLTEALTILQDAIRKIDRETRTKFRETFDLINQKFQEIFPTVFGGGQAYLELMDDDVLSTGVGVKAQPPGKRNTSIHMLSGGEKALTAISLVFALFQLNPAPFCILDEVDAPLDDINVGRFCQLVRKMAKETQFLIISHNKVTIEIADHLMGVTMQEPGVSRIVSVNMEQAIGMVEAV